MSGPRSILPRERHADAKQAVSVSGPSEIVNVNTGLPVPLILLFVFPVSLQRFSPFMTKTEDAKDNDNSYKTAHNTPTYSSRVTLS